MMLRSALLSLTLAAASIAAQPALSAPDCTCRGNGQNIPEGQTVCLKTASGNKLARCERVLNNTSWKMLGEECPVAQLPRQSAWPAAINS